MSPSDIGTKPRLSADGLTVMVGFSVGYRWEETVASFGIVGTYMGFVVRLHRLKITHLACLSRCVVIERRVSAGVRYSVCWCYGLLSFGLCRI